jgi:hypothetical protein
MCKNCPGSRVILLTLLLLAATALMAAAQEFTHTTTSANTVASKSTIYAPGLANNPQAIVVATPTAETARANPHPIGAWFYGGKWNIFNTDHANLAPGLVFKVRVFAEPGPDRFLHVVTRDNVSEAVSYIDNPAINNNPDLQLIILQNHAPDNRAFSLNAHDAKVAYNPVSGRWYIANVNGKALYPNTAYNVVVIGGVKDPSTRSVEGGGVKAQPLPTRTREPMPVQPLAARINQSGSCTNEMAWQTVGKWEPQKKADVAMADRTFPKTQYKALLAKAQKAIDLLMAANPEFAGISASAYSGIRGDSIIPNGPVPFRADVWYKSYICVGNDSASVDKRGKVIVYGNYGFTTVSFNSLTDILESVQSGTPLKTSDGEEILQYNRDLGEERGFPLIQTSHRDSMHEAVVLASNDRLPYKPVSREQYLRARIAQYEASGGMTEAVSGLNRVLANMSSSERSSPALVRDVTTLPGGSRLFATEAEGGRHLVTIDKSYFNAKLPRDTIQLITVRWNWSESDRPKVEMIKAFKRNFDFIALAEMLGT